MNSTLYIYATSANLWPVEQHAPELKSLVKELWGKNYRRISHFIELALVGAKRCVDNSAVAIQADCALVFTSGQGNVSQVVKVTEQIFKQRQPPMPFDFMHITNNMAPFYVAQALALNSSNLTLSHRAFAFETAMELAAFQLQASIEDRQCLIGAVDECAFPLQHHRQRLNLPAETPLAEGSHWLLTGNNEKSALAKLEFCVFANSMEELLPQLTKRVAPSNTTLACGYGIDGTELPYLLQRLNLHDSHDYRRDTAYHDTFAAYAIASFIESNAKNKHSQTLIHINKSSQQRYCALAVTTLSQQA